MKGITLHSVRGSRKSRKFCEGRCAFTLVEMLVVISVIAILLTLVVGVTHIVLGRAATEQTKANMQIIHQAIEEYRIVNGDPPPDITTFPPRPPFPPSPEDWIDRHWHAYCRGKQLYDELISVPQSQAFVAKLKKGAIKNIEGNDVFVDGFDKYMEYYSDKGIGGEPVIISAGADSKFDTEKDIRSDNQ
jgi:prepilin-type N-terminal cleavage/methylation domain-containing protein